MSKGGVRWSHEWEPMAECFLVMVRDDGGVKVRVWSWGVLKVPTMKSYSGIAIELVVESDGNCLGWLSS